MEYIGQRISILKREDSISVVILAFKDKLKTRLLFLWLLVWSLAGIIVLVSYFKIQDENTKIAFIVWLGFWAYFEYKTGYAFFWRISGKEKVRIENGKIVIKRDIMGKGRFSIYSLDSIKNFRIDETTESNFSKSINDSYWIIGGERIAFDYFGREIKFGIQLDEKETLEIYKKIKFYV